MTSRRIGKAFGLVLCLCLPAFAASEVELSASTDASEVALDGTLVLRISATYTSKGDPGELKLPAFADFDVVGEPSRSEQMSFTFPTDRPPFAGW